MKYLVIIMLVSLSAIAGAQAPAIVWQHSYGSTRSQEAFGLCRTPDGGYIMTGTTDTSHSDKNARTQMDLLILRIDSTGAMKWQRSLRGHGYDAGMCIISTRDSGYLSVGYSAPYDKGVSPYHNISNYRIVKLNSSGTVQWDVYYGGEGGDVASSVVQTTDGGYIVAGSSNSIYGNITANHGETDYWIIKLDSSGGLEWQRSYGGTWGDVALCIIQTTDGGYAVAGCASSHDGEVKGNHGSDDYWILKLDKKGAIQWQKCLGGSGLDLATSIAQTRDGGYVVAGFSNSHDGDVKGNHGGNDYWIVKLSARGRLQWQRSLGGSGRDEPRGIVQTADHGYAVVGYSDSHDGDVTDPHGKDDYWVVKLNRRGAMQWQKSLGGRDHDEAYAIVQDPDGSYTIAGRSSSRSDDSPDTSSGMHAWLVKLAAK